MDFYFVVTTLKPDFEELEIRHPSYAFIKRRWSVTPFDLATLFLKHKLHMPHALMEVFLNACNMEICIKEKKTLEEAIETFQSLRLSFYTEGVTPFLAPFIATHSVNEYSGINFRDSGALLSRLDEEQRQGLTSKTGIVEVWPFETALTCITLDSKDTLNPTVIDTAIQKSIKWQKVVTVSKHLTAIQEIAITAPTVIPSSQSHLHIWSGLEALFPTVSSELSFKISLYLSQLMENGNERLTIYDFVRQSYNLRSQITHGSRRSITAQEWGAVWFLFTQAINSIILRGKMPTEKELLAEILS